jgi:antitoxin MazE
VLAGERFRECRQTAGGCRWFVGLQLDAIRVRAYNVITEGGAMRTRLVRIGNSQGIRIPKPVIVQIGLSGEVELTVRENALVVAPVRAARAGWSAAFRAMAERRDDALVDGELPSLTTWDRDEWQWK